MEFNIKEEDGIKIVNIFGDLVAGKLYDIKIKVNELTQSNNPKIIFDFSDVNFIDSSGIGFLINTLKALSKENSVLKLVNLNATAENVLKQMKIYTLFDVYETVEEAIESFS